MKISVIVEFEIDGFHKYPNAPKEVEFLSLKHRHMFNIKAGFEVVGLNRDKEIFIERELIKNYLIKKYKFPCEFNEMSCEMIAREILEFGKSNGMIWCEVLEEKTGGAKIEL
jgi:hypothetical protein